MSPENKMAEVMNCRREREREREEEEEEEEEMETKLRSPNFGDLLCSLLSDTQFPVSYIS